MRRKEDRTGQIPDHLAGRQKTEAEEPVLAFPTGMMLPRQGRPVCGEPFAGADSRSGRGGCF